MIITYKTDDGGLCEVVHYGSSPQPHMPNTAWAEVLDTAVALGLDRYDEEYGALVRMNAAELAVAQTPMPHDVQMVIDAELRDTVRLTADFIDDRPASPHQVADWALYRESLRRLMDEGDHLRIIKNWPERPDGADPISSLRARLPTLSNKKVRT